jgi:hypothetical protein
VIKGVRDNFRGICVSSFESSEQRNVLILSVCGMVLHSLCLF